MSWMSRRGIRVGFWLLAILPIFMGILTFQNVRSLMESAKDVERTKVVQLQLERLLSKLQDVELAQQAFLLTGDEEYTEDLRKLRTAIYQEISDVSKVTRDPQWLALLNAALLEKLEEVDKTMNVRRKEGLEAAQINLQGMPQPRPMNSIRTILRNLVTLEEGQLAARTDAQGKTFRRTMILFGLVLLLNVLLLVAMGYQVRREREQTRAVNQELERRVALRTEALQRSNEDLQQFAYIASHDLKEPMRMVSSYSTLLERKYGQVLDSDGALFLGFINDGVKRMNALIVDLLEYSRAGEVRAESVEPGHALNVALANLKATIAESGAQISVDVLPPVRYDPMRLSQIFQNILGNAIKYRGEREPVIRVSAQQEEDQTVFAVADNGIGIEPKYHDQVFGIFQRLHGKEYEGTGIGLAMVKKIVERHGGRIWVESQPGAGSTFYFSVPLAPPTGEI